MQVLFWLLGDRGFLIHCSALNIDNKAILFLGKQGAGKSTAVSLLSSNHQILADDVGIIREKEGVYFFYQSPSIEKNETIIKTSKKYPIKDLIFLKKTTLFSIVKILDRKILFKKMAYQFLGNLKDMKEKMIFLFKMVNNFNNFYLLSFAKDRRKLKRLITNMKD